MSAAEGVAATLARVTAAWMEARWTDLGAQLHERAVAVHADERAEGREAVVARFGQRSAGVADYRETGVTIDMFGATAVATVRWWMDVAGAGGSRRHSGRDHVVLDYDPEQGEWRILFHATIPDPAPRAAE